MTDHGGIIGGTLTDIGFIGGGSGTNGVAHAIDFGNGAASLILTPGAAFGGAIIADASDKNVMQLGSGGSTGTIADLGTTVTKFGTVEVNAGASGLIAGNTAGLASGQKFDGSRLRRCDRADRVRRSDGYVHHRRPGPHRNHRFADHRRPGNLHHRRLQRSRHRRR